MRREPHTRQRHGGNRGVLVDYRDITATKQFYSATRAPSLRSDPVSLLLPRLVDVKQHGNRWTATCPNGHEHKGGLSVAVGGDGRLMLHCFKGCDAEQVLRAVGLRLADLFPERLVPQTSEQRRAMRQAAIQANWVAARGVLTREATICEIATQTILRGDTLSEDDIARVRLAAQRIHDAREVLRHD